MRLCKFRLSCSIGWALPDETVAYSNMMMLSCHKTSIRRIVASLFTKLGTSCEICWWHNWNVHHYSNHLYLWCTMVVQWCLISSFTHFTIWPIGECPTRQDLMGLGYLLAKLCCCSVIGDQKQKKSTYIHHAMHITAHLLPTHMVCGGTALCHLALCLRRTC